MTTTSAVTTPGGTRDDAERHLRALVGRDDVVLHDDQWAAIEALVVEQSRVLVVQKTGWGKSAVYFVATALMRGLGAGPTVIISPLLALMRNQIEAADRAGIRAATINSTNVEDWTAIRAQGRRRRDRRAAGEPRAAEQPDLPRRGAPPAHRDRRACSSSTRPTASPTGATTSGPTTAGSAR